MKKFVAGMLAACIAFTPIMTPAFAGSIGIKTISNAENEEAENMKKALILVKNKISVPEYLTEFSYRLSYSGGNKRGEKYWNFEWRDKDYTKNINVKCDEAGNIFSYSIYDRDSNKNSKPTYLKEELTKNATEFIEKVAPSISKSIVLDSVTFSGVYSGTYSYTFLRTENGVLMPDNKVLVAVNYETGEVKSFNASWTYNLSIPDSTIAITIEEAREKIGENVNMNLVYRNKTEEVDGNKVVKAYLVYIPDKSYMAVDAKTGQIYDTKNEFFDMSEYSGVESEKLMVNGVMKDMAVEEGMLTEEEIEKINEMAGLITKEDAILAVTSKSDVLLLDENAKAVTARLNQKYDYTSAKNVGYVWNLNFNDPRSIDANSNDTYRAYANASVDAKTGKLLSFNSSVRSYYDSEENKWEDVKVEYSSKECQDTFEKFVRSLEEDKFLNSRLSNTNSSSYILKYNYIDGKRLPVYGGYSYNYCRVNEGIDYTYDGISGNVDGVTGKIYSYNVNWTDNIEFESPRNAMSPEDAYKAYSNKDGFELVYEIYNKHYIENNPTNEQYYDYSDLYILEKDSRLVYRTDINPQYISPFTGAQLNYLGEVYEDVNEKEYLDIDGFWGERDIKLITDMGYTFCGDDFLPNEIISTEEWFKLLELVGSYTSKKEYEDLEKVTKLDAVKMIVKNLGLENVAELSDIYKISFNDVNEDNGYIALAKGLGIVSGDSNGSFYPSKELTRIEAVCMVLKLANVK